MRKNKPLDESRKSRQTSGTKMAFYSKYYYIIRAKLNGILLGLYRVDEYRIS
ncbi:hypothetical protein Hanom_Chr14g01280251 [Helianthus anomalus]